MVYILVEEVVSLKANDAMQSAIKCNSNGKVVEKDENIWIIVMKQENMLRDLCLILKISLHHCIFKLEGWQESTSLRG